MIHKNKISSVTNNQLARLASDFKNNRLHLCLHDVIIFPLGSKYGVSILTSLSIKKKMYVNWSNICGQGAYFLLNKIC